MALERRWSKCITLEGKKRWVSNGNKLGWLLIDSPSYILDFARLSDFNIRIVIIDSDHNNCKQNVQYNRRPDCAFH